MTTTITGPTADTPTRLATISAERLIIKSPTGINGDGDPWEVIFEEQEFTGHLHAVDPTFPLHVGSAVAVCLDIDGCGFDKVFVEQGTDDGMIETMRQAIEALRTTVAALERVNRVTMPSQHI